MSETETALTVVNAELMSVDEYEETKKWIARKQEQGLASGDWKPEVLKVIKTMCCPKTSKGLTIPAPQFEVFMHRVRKYRLDPLNGEIYTIPRMSRYKDERGTWHDGETVWQPFVGRDGYRVIAERTGLVEYVETVVYPEPTPDMDKRQKPVWARCTVKRRDRERPIVAIVYFVEFDTNKSTWADKPMVMIEKVAEAAALKKAFNINGVYEAIEMDKVWQTEENAQKYKALPMPLKSIPEDTSLPSHGAWTAAYANKEMPADRLTAITEAYKEEQRGLRARLKADKPPRGKSPTDAQRRKVEALISERLNLNDEYADRAALKAGFFVELLGLPDGSTVDYDRDQMSKAIDALQNDIQGIQEAEHDEGEGDTTSPPPDDTTDVGMSAEELAAQNAEPGTTVVLEAVSDPHKSWPVPSCPVCGLSETKRARGKDAHFFCKAEGCGARFNRPDDAVLDAIVAGVGELGEDALSALAADTKEAGVPEGHRSWNMVQAATMGRLLAFVVKGAAPGSGDVEF